jgi:hypothetical protein
MAKQDTGTTEEPTKQEPDIAMKLPAPSVEWLLIRDKINVNDELAQEMLAEIEYRELKQGTAVGLIAREIVHAPSYPLDLIKGHPLFLVADVYRGNGGAIDTSGVVGAPGAKGATGKPGVAIQGKSNPGGRGADGKPGAQGTAASPITLIAATIQNASLRALGGTGSAGGNGGTGGRGADGKWPVRDKFVTIPPTNGGPGGNGGNGGNGGPGAQITIQYVQMRGTFTAQVAGGDGGPKGQAGPGGTPGTGGGGAKKGDPGKPGLDGAAGESATVVKTQLQQSQWDSTVLATLGAAADKWAAHRARVGEYAFRCHVPQQRDISLREFARNEFLAAQRLSPLHSDRATHLLQYLDSRLNPLGVAYDQDVMPAFDSFEKVITDYGPLIQILFSDAKDLLLVAADTEDKKTLADIDLNSLQGRREALEFEAQAKYLEGEILLQKFEQTQARLTANRKALEANIKKQAQQKIELADKQIETTMVMVATVILAVVAVPQFAIALCALLNREGLLVKAKSEFMKSGGAGMVDDSGNLKPEYDKLLGGIEALVLKTKALIDKYEAVSDLLNATVDGALESAEKELLIRHLDLTFELNVLALKQQQGLFERAALQKEVETANQDYQLVASFNQSKKKDIQLLGKLARALISQAQGYADVLTKYQFYATRAFDLWTLGNRTSSFAFHRGLLHPDVVEHAFQAMARGKGDRALALVGQYMTAWAKLPDLIKLREEYDDYSAPPDSESLVTETWFYSFTGRGVPGSLYKHGSATFRAELPAGRSEAKILNVAVSLVGATASQPSVTVIVEHTGDATVRRRNGKIIKLHQPPRREPISATFDANDLGDLEEVEKQQFWGRSPSAVWRISIEKESADESNLDLKGLTEVQFAVYYKCFFG